MKSRCGFAVVALGAFGSAANGQQKIWSADGKDMGDFFGSSVDMLPDLDADGVSEVLIGASGDNCGGFAQGMAYEYSTSGGQLDTWCGDKNNEGLGYSVARLGDVDLDGIDDFAIGSPSYDAMTGNWAGRVQVISAKTGGVIYEVVGNLSGMNFGAVIARLPDLDGDGFREMLVSAPGYGGLGPSQGEVFVLSTKDASTLRVHLGEGAQHLFGRTAAALGDMDGDGVDDYAIGARLSLSDGHMGRLYAYSGATGLELWRVTGIQTNDSLGNSIADAGDVDEDGFADVLCSAGFTSNNVPAGRVDAYSGKTGQLLFRIDGVEPQEGFGASCAMVGDTNDDGFSDFLVGAPVSNHIGNTAGRAQLISGATLRTLYNFYPGPPGYVGGNMGTFVGGGADFNGDGRNDFIVSATGSRFTTPKGGRVSIFAANDLYLQAEPRIADVNDTVTLDVRGGAPGAFSIVFITDIDGTPFFEPVVIDFLDGNGELTEDFVVPSEAAGLDFTFLAYATRHPRSPHFIDSSPFTVSIR